VRSSKRPAATVAPEEAAGANALTAYDDDPGRSTMTAGRSTTSRGVQPRLTSRLGAAETLAVAMESGTASVGCIGGAKAGECAGQQNRCKRYFMLSSFIGRDAAIDMVRVRFDMLILATRRMVDELIAQPECGVNGRNHLHATNERSFGRCHDKSSRYIMRRRKER